MHTKINRDSKNVYYPFLLIVIIFFLTTYLLYNNQFNKRLDGEINIRLPFRSVGDRGHIFFTDKNGVPHIAASTRIGYNLNISPLELGDAEEIYEHLNEEIDIDRDDFFRRALKEDIDEYEIIRKNIPEEEKERIQNRINNYDLDGVWLESFKKREYTNDSLAAHVLGFVSVDSNNITRGQYGIENIFDDVLSTSNKITKSAGTILVEQLGEIERNESSHADSIFLTIDINAQRELEKQLNGVKNRFGAKKVGGIIMDPRDGSIIAMGSTPTFDPNTFNEVKDYSVFNNSNIEDVYEMGSVFKALTVAIALDSGRVSKDITYTDRGSVTIDGETISNYDGRGRGANVPIQTILSQSLNTGAVFLLRETGVHIYKNYIDQFRFGDVTRIDLPKEVSGLADNFNSTREIEFATASYGHGFAITPIAAIRAFASLANGGFIVQPYVVKDIQQIRGGGIIEAANSEYNRERKRIFLQSTTEEVTDYLVRAYDNGVLLGTLRDPEYSIAAKTGTAQLVNPDTGQYEEDKSLHSFFGYFPASNPQYIVFLFAVDPNATYASETLAVPFSNLTKYLISYSSIPPDR